MTIQFPDDLVITGGFRVQIWNATKKRQISDFVADVVAPPFNI